MTLILTTLADDAVTQTAETKLTMPDGSEYTDKSIKSTIVQCANAKFIIGYTGLALIGNVRTDHWLMELLTDNQVGRKGLGEIPKLLELSARETFLKLKHLGDRRRITFICAGYGPSGPFAALVTNSVNAENNRMREINDAFQTHWFLRNNSPLNRVALFINGEERGIEARVRNGLAKLSQRFVQFSPDQRVRICVDLTRRASDHEKYGKYIGRDCIGTILTCDGQALSAYHSENSVVGFSPHFVGPQMSMRDGFATTDENEAARERERILAKLPLLRGT